MKNYTLIAIFISVLSMVCALNDPGLDALVNFLFKGKAYCDLTKEQRQEYQDSLPDSSTVTKFLLYTRRNRLIPQELKDAQSISTSEFNANLPTRFIIPGWTQTALSVGNIVLEQGFLDNGDYNMIVVAWGATSVDRYSVSRFKIPQVGEDIANMIELLRVEAGLDVNNLGVVGHSLGAQVAGMAGKATQYLHNYKIGFIIALDPSGPLFCEHEPENRVHHTDATYVESIHTNADGLAAFYPIGHLSFYPNGGKAQIGCLFELMCSHAAAIAYYFESLYRNTFYGYECASISDVSLTGLKCSLFKSSWLMADQNNAAKFDDVKRIFYVKTTLLPPWGSGIL